RPRRGGADPVVAVADAAQLQAVGGTESSVAVASLHPVGATAVRSAAEPDGAVEHFVERVEHRSAIEELMTPRQDADRATASVRAVRADARRRLGRMAPRGRSWRPPAWGLVVAGLATGLVAGLGYAQLAPAQYEARGHVVVRATEGTDPASAVGFAQLYGRLASDPVVLAEAGRLPGEVRASTSPDAPVIEITGTAGRPADAAAVANAVAPALVAYGNDAEPITGAELIVLSEALPPTDPSGPTATASGAVGAATGGVAAALFLLARHHRREHSASDAAGGSAAIGSAETGYRVSRENAVDGPVGSRSPVVTR
uniref:hypothetical protein n=1 Tax=Streptomyces sp. SM14 TaxID=1736045 RepID=UPI000CD55718